MFLKGVVASDLSAESEQLIDCLGGLHELGTKELILAHALGIKHLEEMKYEMEREVEPLLLDQKRKIEAKGFKVKIEIGTGLPNLEINRIAEKEKASFIIVASHAENVVAETFFASTASDVIHSAKKPVLIIRPSDIERAGNVKCINVCGGLGHHLLYATDFSDNSELAFEYVEELVECGCKKITLLHVQDKQKIEKHLKDKLAEFNKVDTERLERLKVSLVSKGATDVSIEIPYGSPISEILGRAKSGNFTMIVMGSQGRGFISEIFLGSVSHNVARHAPLPVLLVPALR